MRDREQAGELVVTRPWTAQSARIFEEGRAHRLVLNCALGFNEPSLEFLRGLPIRELQIIDRRLTTLEPIYSLAPTLESLHVTTHPDLKIRLTELPRLHSLGAFWAQVKDTIGQIAGLEHLFLLTYTPDDLEPLSSHVALETLRMKDRPKLSSLAGLSQFPKLDQLGIYLASRLKDISALRSRSAIRELELESCKKLKKIDDLAECVGLRRLNLADCGDIESLGPLRGLTQLEELYLYESTKILDQDLSPIAGLPRLRILRMMNRRGYNPSVHELQARMDGT
ncbi:leucine-rich repeat domain-containing protein [Sinomonas mesophila]|uniref:leucine-rich repeat domain-containing protein n=1 Tax=Sinomonas mesophila TaxID=1531955 RepID=UPI00111573BC|nr:leucine-rich repeat domain-containing protein [Sinomonas mesophila]